MPDDAGRLEALIARAQPRLRRQFAAAVALMRQEGSLATLADLVAAGRIDEALGVIQRATGRLATGVNSVFVVAGESTATFIGSALDVIIDFDQVNQRAVSLMRENRFRLVREFAQEQARATREALVDGITRGLNPRDQARAFRSSLGLTQNQVKSVNNFRRLLESNSSETLTRQLRDRRFDSTLRSAISSGEPLSPRQIDTMVGRYNQRSIAHRAKTIARTESLRSVHEGNDEMFAQAFESGDLKRDELIQTWETARDDRVRDSHDFMQGQERRVDIPFETGNGNLLRFPGDPDAPAEEVVTCRCALTNRIAA